MKIPNKKFIWKTIQFIVFVLILDFLMGRFLSHLYFNQKKGQYAIINQGIFKTKADVLVFGSSNAIHHFDPQIIKELTGLDTFHLGREGFEIIYHNAVFHCVLKRHVPKIAILSLTPIELSNIDTYDRLAALLPYADKFDHVKRTLALRGRFEFLKMQSGIYPFNSMLISLLNGFRPSQNMEADTYSNSGYKPLYGRINLERKLLRLKNEHALDDNRVAALKAFMEKAKSNGIKLVVVFSPWYYSFAKNTLTKKSVKEIARKYDVEVLDYLSAEQFVGRSELFWDEGHLNHDGAQKLTRDVCTHIKKGK